MDCLVMLTNNNDSTSAACGASSSNSLEDRLQNDAGHPGGTRCLDGAEIAVSAKIDVNDSDETASPIDRQMGDPDGNAPMMSGNDCASNIIRAQSTAHS